MNKIRKFSHGYGDGLTAPLAPGAEIVANIEYWPLDRYSSGRGTNRGGTYKKATAKEGQLRWSVCSDDMTTACGVDEDCTATGATCVADPLGGRGRFVYPYVDGPIANTNGGAVAGGIADAGAADAFAGVCSNDGTTGCKIDGDCPTGATCILAAYGAVCSDDMMAPCAMDTDCTAPATCVLKPTDRQGYLTEPEPMHTYWPFGYNRTTHAWTYGYCPLAPDSDKTCCCETDTAGVAYFEDCTTRYPEWDCSSMKTGDMKVVPVTRQNVTVAAKATKVTLRLCRGECHNDKNLGHVDDDGDRKKGDKESADAHGFFGALKYDVQVDANGPLGYGADGVALATGENGPYESIDSTRDSGLGVDTSVVWGSGGHPNAQSYGVVGGKVPLKLPDDLETADDYRILVHEESTGLTCRSDYFTIANAGEVPTPAPVRRAPPTPRPTPPRATHAPTPAPTPSTITFAPEPQFWQKGSTQTVEIRIGDVDQAYSYGFGAVVDLLLYEADGADPVGTLAVYAQVAGNKLSVDYAVPAGLAGADFRLRAIEYTRGLDVYSKPCVYSMARSRKSVPAGLAGTDFRPGRG